MPKKISFFILLIFALVLSGFSGCGKQTTAPQAAPTPASPAVNAPEPTTSVTPPAAQTPASPTPVKPVATPAKETPSTVTVTVDNFAFTPQTLTVSVGTTVIWQQQDSAPHTIVSSNLFASDTLTSGESFSYKFTTPGEFTYYCSIHPSMKGKIIVK